MKIHCSILLCLDSLSENPTIYIRPPPSIFLMENEPAALYYIFASNGGTAELVAAQNPSLGEVIEDDQNLQVILNNGVSGNSLISIFAAFVSGMGIPLQYSNTFRQDINVTLIGK